MKRNLRMIASFTYIRKFTGRTFNSSVNGWSDPLFEATVDDDYWTRIIMSKMNAYPAHVPWGNSVFNPHYDHANPAQAEAEEELKQHKIPFLCKFYRPMFFILQKIKLFLYSPRSIVAPIKQKES